MNRTALIFGVTGQDGSYLAELLLNEGYRVVGVARRQSLFRPARIQHLLGRDGFVLEAGDVTDPLCVYRLVRDSHAAEVYNLAAQSHVGVSFGEPSHTTDVTYKGCLNCLEAIRTLGPGDGPRFYQASSSEMFGSSLSFWGHDDNWYSRRHDVPCAAQVQADRKEEVFQDEETPFLPNSPYAVAKLAAHHLCRVYRDSYGVFACSGILFNHESERRGDTFVTRKITLWAAHVWRAILNNRPLPVLKLGNVDAARDWGHAEDYVRGMHLMLRQDRPDDYVLATGEAHTVREFLDLVIRHLEVATNRPGVFGHLVETDPSLFRPSEVPFLRGDAGKARSVLGWRPEVSFAGLVERMVQSDRVLVYKEGLAQ